MGHQSSGLALGHAPLYDRTVVGPDERDLTTGAEKPGDI